MANAGAVDTIGGTGEMNGALRDEQAARKNRWTWNIGDGVCRKHSLARLPRSYIPEDCNPTSDYQLSYILIHGSDVSSWPVKT
jgi:hypothetical protein